MNKTNPVRLSHFNFQYLDILNQLELPVEQIKFTALPSNMMEVNDGQYRIVILNDHEPVGFFLLHSTDRVKEYSSNPNAMLLTAFSIDHRKQGKGFAKEGMLQLREFVRHEFSDCNEIVLAVNHKNIPAQKLYLTVGFRDTGLRKLGPIGEQYIMSLTLYE